MLSLTQTVRRFFRPPSLPHAISAAMPASICSSPRSVMSSTTPLLTHGVTPTGAIVLDPSLLSPVLEQWSPGNSTTHTLLLNRPSALHALSAPMCSAIYHRLRQLAAADKKCVVLASRGSPGRAFCAGGDVRAVYKLGVDGDFSTVDDLFRVEFRMNSLLGKLQPSTVSILDGIVMGGGAGLSVHGKFRVATENTVFAMPECAIGLSPDVGASYFLSRLKKPGLGMYLALTGARLKGAQVKEAGIATHFVKAETVAEVVNKLQASEIADADAIHDILKAYESTIGEDGEISGLGVIRTCFTANSVESIVSKLQAVANGIVEPDAWFASSVLELMKKGCPTSLKIAFQAQKRGAQLSLDDCLRMEFRIVARCLRRDDFYAGVRSALITKDRNPAWNPSNLEEVSEEIISNIFEALANDVQIPELELDGDGKKPIERPQFSSCL